tara:strand:- start:132 stop:449 length:318 start_codon:yes stop_codon:yes gene_type:complete
MIELEKIHLVNMLQMPGGHSEIVMRGEKNGTVTSLHLNCDRGVVEVIRNVGKDVHKRLVPLSNIQSMEEFGGKQVKASQTRGSERSKLEPGTEAAGRRGRPKKKG